MASELQGRRVAILVENGVEEVELTEPRKALEASGARTDIVSPHRKVKAWNMSDWGDEFDCDVDLETASAQDYDALLLPGGVMNPDRLRMNPRALEFVRNFFEAGKPVASICHGPWTLIDAGVVKGRTMTSYPSLGSDLVNAGARWVDREVVVDQGLVTSRNPDDLPAFNRKMVEEFSEGRHQGQRPH
jgi:protease I